MAGGSAGKFSCPTCGKQFRWKPEIAGKKARCKCGGVLSVPTEMPGDTAATPPDDIPPIPPPPPPPPVPAAQQDDLYGFKEHDGSAGGPCPGCGADLAPGAVVCMNCGYDTRTGQRTGTRVAAGEPEGASATATATLPRTQPATKAADRPAGNWKGYLWVAGGLALMAWGVYELIHFDPAQYETMRTGGRRGGYRAILKLAYNLGGKWGVFSVMELLGAIVAFFGWATAQGHASDEE